MGHLPDGDEQGFTIVLALKLPPAEFLLVSPVVGVVILWHFLAGLGGMWRRAGGIYWRTVYNGWTQTTLPPVRTAPSQLLLAFAPWQAQSVSDLPEAGSVMLLIRLGKRVSCRDIW